VACGGTTPLCRHVPQAEPKSGSVLPQSKLWLAAARRRFAVTSRRPNPKAAACCRNPNYGLWRHDAALPSRPAAHSQKRQRAAAVQTVACGGTTPLCRHVPQPVAKSGSALPQSKSGSVLPQAKLWLAAARRRFAVTSRRPNPKAAACCRSPNYGLWRHDAALPSRAAAGCQKRQRAAAVQKRQHAAAVQKL